MARPGTLDRLSAAISVAGAVVVGGYFVVIGAQARQPALFVAAAVAVVVFGVLARRSWRLAQRAGHTAAPVPATAVVAPGAGGATSTLPDAVRVVPVLSVEGRERLDRVLDVLVGAGVLPDGVVDPGLLAASVADHGEPVTSGTVLGALDGAGPDGWDARLDRHPAQDGVPALPGPGGPRLAWLWTDRTVWVAAPAQDPAELNDLLDQPADELWEWVDEARARERG
ncbi:hypothetical protein [Pseudonocardia sp. ICBG1293]|uniref:hypothetical protein n=1 Tax=Pseudonocardia sp. ICBG1293 TaxID=2844382 RepID=UPI001CCE5D06|nr:hypothetical protein [Pseudonocardia sp. ICBG1293]